MSDNVTAIAPADISQWVTRIFEAAGMRGPDAEATTDNLVTADLRGVYSHGVMRVPMYVRRLLVGTTDAQATPEIENDVGAVAVVTGNNAMGQVAGKFAMELAIEKARTFGVGYVAVKESNHYGAAAHFSRMALRHDMIGMSGTIGGTNIMAPWGGTDRRLGNNPYSSAIPALKKDDLVFDMAHSVVARGKIVYAAKVGEPIPDTWALDEAGLPTTDPVAAYAGTVQPAATYKGYGHSLMTGVLSSILPGASFGDAITDAYEASGGPQNLGHYMQAVNISAFRNVRDFRKEVDEAIHYMKSSAKRPDCDEILVPGEPEARMERSQLERGIEYPFAMLSEIADLSTELSVAVPKHVSREALA